MRRFLAFGFALMLTLTALGGCQENDGDTPSTATVDFPVTAFDTTVPACPQRVVSLSPAVTDILDELGSDAQLSGISNYCRLEKELPRCGTSLEPDLEQIQELEPDVIFATTALSDADKKAMEDFGAVVIPVQAAESYTDLLAEYTQVACAMSGGITGPRNASNTFDRLDAKLKAVNNRSEKVPVAVYFSSSIRIPPDGLADNLIGLAGGENLCRTETDSDQTIAAGKPQVILCPAELTESLRERFPDVRVEAFDVTLLESHGARMIDAVEQMYALLHP